MDVARSRSYAPLVVILIAAAALEGLLLARLPTVSADGITFIRIARELSAAPLATMQSEDQHPGFPAMLLAATRLAQWLGYDGDPESWIAGGLVVSCVCGLLAIAFVWLLARDLFDTTIANIAAVIFTVLPVPRAAAVDAQSDTPHACFYLLSAWLATTGIVHGNLWRLAGAGLAGGLAFWIRPEGLEAVLVALPFVVWQGFRGRWPWRRRLLAVGATAGVAFLVAAPYVLLAGKLTSKQLTVFKDKPVPTYIERVAEGRIEPGDEAEQLAVAPLPAQPMTKGDQRRSPAPAPKSPAPKSPSPATAQAAAAPPDAPPKEGYSARIVLSLVGLAFAAFINSICQGLKFVFIPWYLLGDVALMWRRPAGVQIAYLALLGAAHIAILMAVYVLSGYVAHRHVIPLVGLAAPFAALGIYQTGQVLGLWLRVRPAYCRVALVTASCAAVLPYTLRHLNREFVPVIEATRWVTQRLEPGGGIVCNSPYVLFYGRRPVAELLPLAPTLDLALRQAPDARYDYVVLHVNAYAYQDEWIDQITPYYRQVLEIPDPHPYARPKKVLVFQVKDGPLRNAALPPPR